jgi:hypothetical protein
MHSICYASERAKVTPRSGVLPSYDRSICLTWSDGKEVGGFDRSAGHRKPSCVGRESAHLNFVFSRFWIKVWVFLFPSEFALARALRHRSLHTGVRLLQGW